MTVQSEPTVEELRLRSVQVAITAILDGQPEPAYGVLTAPELGWTRQQRLSRRVCALQAAQQDHVTQILEISRRQLGVRLESMAVEPIGKRSSALKPNTSASNVLIKL